MTLLSRSELLSDGGLDSLLLGTLGRSSALPDEKDSFVVGASLRLDRAELLLALLLGDGELLAHLVTDLLANSTLVAVLALLDKALLVKLLTTALGLTGDHLCLALVGTVKLVLDHLESELGLVRLLLETLFDGWGGAVIKSPLDLDLDDDGFVEVGGTGGGGLVAHC